MTRKERERRTHDRLGEVEVVTNRSLVINQEQWERIRTCESEIVKLKDDLEQAHRFDKFTQSSLSTRKVLWDLLDKLGFKFRAQERVSTFINTAATGDTVKQPDKAPKKV